MQIRILWPIIDLFKGDNQFVGIMMISSLLKKHGFHSEVVEADAAEIKKWLQRNVLTVVAFSTPTVYAQTYIELNRRLKRQFHFFSVFGGPHPTFFPELIEEEGIDGICRGEGEYAMLDLATKLSEGKPVSHIDNWWMKENGRVFKNPLRPLIQNLDELPIADHEIFREAIPNSIWQALVMTSRGCPYHCTYCYNHVFKKLYGEEAKTVRRRSVDNVIEELKMIKQHDCYQFIRFLDDLFILSGEWIEEFSEKYRREIGLPFSCLVRANLVTVEIVRNLKRAGCCRIMMGLESGDDYVRNEIFKRAMSEDQIVQAARIIKDAGLKLVTANIIGSPGGSLSADFKTLTLNMKIKPDYAGVSLLQPYPGTEIYKYAKTHGMLDFHEPNLREKTVSRFSTLKYQDEREKNSIENLQKLFFIGIEWPWLLPFVKKLIRLPPNPVYHFIFSKWVIYCHYFRAIPSEIGWRVILKRTKLFFLTSRRFRSAFSGSKGWRKIRKMEGADGMKRFP